MHDKPGFKLVPLSANDDTAEAQLHDLEQSATVINVYYDPTLNSRVAVVKRGY